MIQYKKLQISVVMLEFSPGYLSDMIYLHEMIFSSGVERPLIKTSTTMSAVRQYSMIIFVTVQTE